MGGTEIQGGMAEKHGNTVGRGCNSDGETAQRARCELGSVPGEEAGEGSAVGQCEELSGHSENAEQGLRS